MVIRKKSRFERFLSLNQHKKRLGASQIERDLQACNLADLKAKTIDLEETNYTHGADKNLNQHLEDLRAEFSGQSELLYYHAKLIVLIRRNYKPEIQFQKFTHLWSTENVFLLRELNIRWLVSASDTFADHSDDPTEKAIALSISLLINTIKLQETERFIQGTQTVPDNQKNIEALQKNRVALFDGTSAFAVGTDDTLRNMRWRMGEVCETSSTLGKLLQEIFSRLQNQETVYSRFKKRHSRKKTAWW